MENRNPAVQALAELIIPEEVRKATHFAVMLFVQGHEIGLEGEDAHTWLNVRNIECASHGQALNLYANIPCPASQLIIASSEEELHQKMEKMVANFNDPEFLDELYETL